MDGIEQAGFALLLLAGSAAFAVDNSRALFAFWSPLAFELPELEVRWLPAHSVPSRTRLVPSGRKQLRLQPIRGPD